MDSVYFYVHYTRLLRLTNNLFGGHLRGINDARKYSPERVLFIKVEEASPVLDIVLHAIYDLPCDTHTPTFDILSAAVRTLHKYGAPVQACLETDRPLGRLVLNRAPLNAVEAFAIAAENSVETLAVAISPYLLAVELDKIPIEPLGVRIGIVYYMRVHGLQERRNRLFKSLVAQSPYPHPLTPTCTSADRDALTRAWNLAVAALIMNSSPGT